MRIRQPFGVHYRDGGSQLIKHIKLQGQGARIKHSIHEYNLLLYHKLTLTTEILDNRVV